MMSNSDPQTHPPTGQARRSLPPWLGIAVLVVPLLMVAVDMTVLFLAIPRIATELSASGTQQLWVLHGGELVGAGLVLTAGRLVDRFGARRVLTAGLLGYAVASLLAALAVSVEMLVAARMLLGAVTVTITPSAMALARRMFPDERRFATAVAVLMAAFSAGMALGPLIGGALLEAFWWGAVFLVNVPVAALVLLAVRWLPSVPGSGTGGVDVWSVALSLAGLAGLVYGGQELAAQGLGAWPNAVIAVGGVLLLVLFVRRQRRLPEPLLDVSLFTRPPFVLSLLMIMLVITVDTGAELQLAQHLQVVTGLTPLTAGLALAVPAVVAVAATAAAPVLLRWFRAATVMSAGAVLAVLGAVGVLLLAGRPDLPLGWLLLSASVVAAGMSPAFALGTALVLSSAPTEATGSAQATQEVSGSLGQTLGLAVSGSVALLVYGGALRELAPAGVEPGLVERSTQGGGIGLEVAAGLPGRLGEELRAGVVSAFAEATSAAYLVAAAGFAVVVVLGLVLRRLHRPDDPAGAPTAAESEPAGTER